MQVRRSLAEASRELSLSQLAAHNTCADHSVTIRQHSTSSALSSLPSGPDLVAVQMSDEPPVESMVAQQEGAKPEAMKVVATSATAEPLYANAHDLDRVRTI